MTRRPPPIPWPAAALLFFVLAAPAQGALLRLHAVGPDGHPVDVEMAQVLLVAWGGTRVVDLPVYGDLVFVDLSHSWLASQWPRDHDTAGAYLFLAARGLAPVRSDRFQWIGAYGETPGETASRAEIRFPGNGAVTVEPGAAEDLSVRLRRPMERRLRLVDGDGQPMAGLGVSLSMFWSRSNHCGALASARHHPLGHAVSDAEGRVPVPDGDFELALEFDPGPYWPDHPDATDYLPPTIITRLTAEETTLIFHRFEPRQYEVRITRRGQHARDVQLVGCVARCPCGACCGSLASVDQGVARLGAAEPFYPEATREILVYEEAGKTILWRSDSVQWPDDGILEIELEE